MSTARIGTAARDRAVYDGRELLGYLRGSVAGCYAYGPTGEPVGAAVDQKAAVVALIARAAKATAGA